MAVVVGITGEAIGADPIILHETGKPAYLLEGLSPITRRSDPYSGQSAIASAGTWLTNLDNREGLFYQDGIFSAGANALALFVAIDDVPVFIGRLESIEQTAGSAGLKTAVRWRDLVEDWLSLTVPTGAIRLQRGGGRGSGAAVAVHARTGLRSTLDAYSVTYPSALADMQLWLPQQVTDVRRWLLPIVSALGYQVDWTATYASRRLSNLGITLIPTTTFRNTSLPVFGNKHLLGKGGPRTEDGRRQIINAWSGRFFFEGEDGRLESENVNVYARRNGFAEQPIRFTGLHRSRTQWGLRRGRLEVPMVDRALMVDTMSRFISGRYWPHYRYEVSLNGATAAALRIGDGIIMDTDLGTTAGRGLALVGRVISRTVDLATETTRVLLESRDGRDPDYRAWASAGGQRADAPDP